MLTTYSCLCKKCFSTKRSLQAHRSKCIIFQNLLNERIEKHLTKKFLTWWFEKKKYSANRLTTIFSKKYLDTKISASVIINRAKSFNIHTWTVHESKFLPTVHVLYEGINNILSKNNKGYITRQKTLKKEGITNVFQRKSVIEQIKKSLFKNHGVTCVSNLSWYKRNNGFESNEHKTIIKYLEECGYILNKDFYSEPKKELFYKYNEELNKFYSPRPDIVFINKKIVIEIDSDLYHANPDIFSDEKIIRKWKGNFKAEDIRKFEHIRDKHIESFGYKIIHIWCSEIHKNLFKEKLKEL